MTAACDNLMMPSSGLIAVDHLPSSRLTALEKLRALREKLLLLIGIILPITSTAYGQPVTTTSIYIIPGSISLIAIPIIWSI